jgi:hypothetical protein
MKFRIKITLFPAILWALIFISLFGLVAICCLGCTTVEYKDFKYTRTVFDQQIGKLKVRLDPNDPTKILSFEMEAQKSDADMLMDAIKVGAGAALGTQVK